MALFACSGTLAAAQNGPQSDILTLINSGQFDAARTALQRQATSPAETAFWQGRILKVQGDLDAAIDAFRQSLAYEPAALPARRELAHTLLLAGQFDVAQFHFDELLRIDPDTAQHDAYRQFLMVIRRNKPFGVSGHFAFVPSTNINRGSTQTIFDTASGTYVIDPNALASSGVGVQLGVTGFLRHAPSPNSRWILGGSLIGTGYGNEIHNTATASVSLTYEHSYERWRWSLGPHASATWRKDDADQRIAGLRFGVSYRMTPRSSLGLTALHEERSYPNQAYKDGPFTQLTFNLAHQIDPSLVMRAGISIEQGTPAAAHLQHEGYSLTASLSKTWQGGLMTALAVDLGKRDFIGNYPLTTTPRRDEFARLSISLQHPRVEIRGFTPRLTCSHTINQSNVAFYDYDATECQATLSTEF